MKKWILISLLQIIAIAVQSQDASFSQFYLNPMSVNPALTGAINGAQRFGISYRNQWSQLLRENAFSTYRFDYDTRFHVNDDFIGVGASVFTDKSGSLNLRQSEVQTTLSYGRQIMGNSRSKQYQYIVAAFQGGIGQRQLNLNASTWGSQSNNGSYDPNMTTHENLFVNDFNNKLYADASLGLLWYGVFNKNNFYAGTGYFHLNQPRQSLTNSGNSVIARRLAIHGGGTIQIGSVLSLVPQIIVQSQAKAFEMNLGTGLRMAFDKNNTIFAQIGLWNRFGNSINSSLNWQSLIIAAKIDMNDWAFAVAYDMNVSIIGNISRAGGLELNISYLLPAAKRIRNICPTF
jgi:type IX secretion system PorP/SprF family membrane protein